MQDSVEKDLAGFIGREVLQENRAVGPDEVLFSSGLVNSFGLLRILTYASETHGVSIEGFEVADAGVDTVRALAEMVAKRRT